MKNKTKKKTQWIIVVIAIIASLILLKFGNVWWECRNHGDFDSEKKETLQRRDYLAEKLIVKPIDVLLAMPSDLGEQFMGEWALYSCSMFADALVNISKLYPETKNENLHYIDSLIQIVRAPEIRRYDAVRWGEDPLTSLSGDKSHLSYLSHLAWMIGGYKSIDGGGDFDELYTTVCETLNRRILQSTNMNLETYPNEPIYIPDMLVAIVALRQYAQLNNGKYMSTVNAWLKKAREQWCDAKTGLLVSYLSENGEQMQNVPIRGSYSALNCSYLSLIEENFAQSQYKLLKKYFWKDGLLAGFNEYLDKSPSFAFDVDAGPIIIGRSPSGTAFSLGAVTYFNDDAVRTKILRTAEIVGQTSPWGKRHYFLANFALVGEAVMLSMRTNVNWNKP